MLSRVHAKWPARIAAALHPGAAAREMMLVLTGGRAEGKRGEFIGHVVLCMSCLTTIGLLFVPGVLASLGCLLAAVIAACWLVRMVQREYHKGHQRANEAAAAFERGREMRQQVKVVLVVAKEDWPPSRWLDSDNPALRN